MMRITNELKVSYLQCDIEWENTKANLEHYTKVISEQPYECDLLVLPEMFHCGFTSDPHRVAQLMDGEVVEWMRLTAQQYSMAITGSIVVAEGAKFYNRLVFVYPNGQIIWYDKRHLFRMGNEHHRFEGGDKRLVVQYKGWRILPLVCYDLRFPVWSRNRNDYDLMLVVANWPSSRREVWNVLLKARAIENQCYVVGVNRVGKDPVSHYSGDSQVIDSRGIIVSAGPECQEALCFYHLDLEMLVKFRSKFPAYMDSDDFKLL